MSPRALDGHLSPGQLAALRLAASGYTSRQIAARLGTTEDGIHLRLTTAARSLGGRSRTHAVAIALKRGLIGLDEVESGQGPRGALGGRLPDSEPTRGARDGRGAARGSGGRAAPEAA